jgi:succinoglycan biosynthesis protein ExoA
MNNLPGVSVILPILNEEKYLAATAEAILEQDYQGEWEIIFSVGPSRDRTMEVARALAEKNPRIHVVENPTGRTPNALNIAISHSRYPIICRIDGHAEVSTHYISDAVKILLETGAVNVGGLMAAEGITAFEKSVARAMRSPLGVGSSRFHTGGTAGSVDTVYLGTFRKDALLSAGGYDERFTRAQDWELNFRLRKNGGTIWFDPRLVVTYRPRSTLKALARQYFNYGRWRHVVSRSHKGSGNFRYLAPPTALLINTVSIFGGFFNPWLFLPSVIYIGSLIIGSLLIGKSLGERVRLPLILLTMHMVWGLGYITSPRNLLTRGEKNTK